ncbi:hypothetical protein F4775DRAFT_560778 [Biscogniauxia sp. FL1348]|nr:hypothetical protein F4775DRAFT_560778 [Biscogniauxia sp. FL1348]
MSLRFLCFTTLPSPRALSSSYVGTYLLTHTHTHTQQQGREEGPRLTDWWLIHCRSLFLSLLPPPILPCKTRVADKENTYPFILFYSGVACYYLRQVCT